MLKFKEAICFPLIISGSTTIKDTKRGSIIFTSKRLRPGMLSFGLSHLNYSYPAPNFIKIQGKLIVNGNGNHLFGPGGRLTIRQSGILELGNNFSLGHFSCIIVQAHSSIGDNNMFSWETLIMDNDSHPIYDGNDVRINNCKRISIGNKVWIGARCTILKGAEIPDGCIIATNSIVNKRLSCRNSVYASSRHLKSDIRWEPTIT